jgi:hypothetical protein
VILSNCTHSEHNAERMRAKLLKNGAPGEIRTPDLQLRRLPLYPAELRAHTSVSSVHAELYPINWWIKGHRHALSSES